jgi:hypothetical protein
MVFYYLTPARFDRYSRANLCPPCPARDGIPAIEPGGGTCLVNPDKVGVISWRTLLVSQFLLNQMDRSSCCRRSWDCRSRTAHRITLRHKSPPKPSCEGLCNPSPGGAKYVSPGRKSWVASLDHRVPEGRHTISYRADTSTADFSTALRNRQLDRATLGRTATPRSARCSN